jgi:hypothetical protein
MTLFTLSLITLVGCGDASGPPPDASAEAGLDASLDAAPDAPDTATPDTSVGEVIPAETLGLAADPPGEWLAGDVHVHATGASNDTGGDSHPEDIKAQALARGLFFVVLTDHSNSTGSDTTTTEEDPDLFNMGPEFPYWDRAAELSEEGTFLMIDGNEISPVAEGERPTEARGHIGCIPEDLETFDRDGAIVDRPRGDVTGGDGLDQALARGCFAVLNHPYSTPWISYDWTRDGYHAMEVWNGTIGLDDLDLAGHAAWRCDLLQGKTVTPIGASDNHRVNEPPPGELFDPALGYPATAVFAAGRTWPAIIAALRAGEVALYEGDTRLFLHGYVPDGSRGESAQTTMLRVRGRLDDAAPWAELTLTRATACEDTRPDPRTPPTLTEDVLIRRRVLSGDSFDWVFEIEGEPGVYTAMMLTRSLHYGAMSRAVVISE